MAKIIDSINHFFAYIGTWLQSPILLILRVYFGIGFIIAAFGKFQDLGKFREYLVSLNIPYPEFFAWATPFSELIGGVLLIIGLLSRFASIPLIIAMCAAYATAHVESLHVLYKDPSKFVSEPPFNFLLTSLLVLAFGPGCFSLDAYFCRKTCGPKDVPKEP